MKALLKKLISSLGYTIMPTDLTRDPYQAQKNILKNRIQNFVIFDVGAHIGQTALKYHQLFPNAKIFCFEPFLKSYDKLKINTEHFPHIKCYNFGLGEISGKTVFHSNLSSATNSILPTHELGKTTWGSNLLDTQETLEIELLTIDDFVTQENIENIDILKMDVQGAEYMVINGAKKTLEKGFIKLIYLEIITMPTYKNQKNLEEMISICKSYEYELFNLFELSSSPNGQLRQVDAIFIKSDLNK